MTAKMQSLGTVRARPIWSLLLLVGLVTTWLGSAALGQSNSWATILAGKWETNSNWSLGVAPNSTQTATFIINAASKTVTIDATTSGSFPSTLTISNLTVSAPIDSQNELFLNNVGLGTPLRILNSLAITNNATLLVYSNSMVQLVNVSSSGSLIIDGGGFVNVLNGGALIATNSVTVIGNTGAGSMVVTAGTMRVSDLYMGYATGSQGTLTLAGANAEIRDNWLVGYGVGSHGAVWMTGGQLTASNSFGTIGFNGSGQMTVSNGTVLGEAIYVGENFGMSGTLTVAGGTIISGLGNFYGALTIGNNVGSTGAVWIVGGQLLATNSSPVPATTTVLIGYSGTAQMTLSNGVVNVGTIDIAQNPGSAGTLTVAGGTLIANQLVATNNSGAIQFPAGVMTLGGAQIANGQEFVIGGAGQTAVLNLVGGTNYFANGLSPGFVSNSTGVAWLTGGQLNTTNAASYVGWYGNGQITVSNGTWLAYSAYVGYQTGSQGTLTIAGGTNIFSSLIDIAPQMNSTGTVWLTGGELVATNFAVILAEGGVGQMTISNGTFLAGGLIFGDPNFALGTLTVAGGTTILGGLGINDGTQTVWMTGGQLTVNGTTTLGDFGIGRMTVSNGQWRAHNIVLGIAPGSAGTLTIAGGVSSVYSNLTIGSTNCTASSIVLITGGELHVTNDDAAAVLEVRSGTLIQTGGLLDVDRIVVTNSCAHFIHMGGTLIYGLQTLTPEFDADGDGIPNGYEQANGLGPLNPTDANKDSDGDGMSNLQEYLAGTDPNDGGSALRIIGMSRLGNAITVVWTGGRGVTNALERTSGGVGGSYSTNGFTVISTSYSTGSGPITNTYTESVVLTNTPSLFYRARLLP